MYRITFVFMGKVYAMNIQGEDAQDAKARFVRKLKPEIRDSVRIVRVYNLLLDLT